MNTWRSPATCWSRQEADHLIPLEAEAVQDAVFHATHVPLALTEVQPSDLRVTTSTGGADEHEVLRYVLGRRGTDIIPVLGKSGAGKSHLVRWLRNETLRSPDDAVRVVFVPKHRTSLYGVVERVLGSFEDESFAEPFREKLSTAREADATDQELRERLRDEIARGVRFHPERTDVPDDQVQHRVWLSSQLPNLLRDPHFSPRYLQDGAAIAKLVEEKRHGRAADDAVDDAFRFSSADISVTMDDTKRASDDAKQIAAMLAGERSADEGSVGPLLALAVTMVNDQMPSALKAVFGIGGEDLKDLFFSIRRALLAQGQRLLLLVEDFSMFQGLQGGLLDAVTQHGTDADPLCDLVTVMAVTTDYFEKQVPDTVKTRSSVGYLVSRQPDATIERFVATYLRAIRAGRSELEAAYRADRLPTSVCDTCPVRERCQDPDAFGGVEGEGLFPLNATMLGRALRAVNDGEFNAREVLNRILRPVLVNDHLDLERGTFPTSATGERFDVEDVPISVADRRELQESGDGARREILALLYADEPSRADLHPALHDAFSLPQRGVDTPADSLPAPSVREGSASPSAAVPPLVDVLEGWSRNGINRDTDRRKIQSLVHPAIVSRLPFADGAHRASVWAPPSDRTKVPEPRFRVTDVDVDGRALRTGTVYLNLDGQDVRTVETVQTLAWMDAVDDLRQIPDLGGRLGRASSTLDRWAAQIGDQLGAWADVDDDLVAIVQSLETAAAFCGARTSAKPSLQARLSMLLSDDVRDGRDPSLQNITDKVKSARDGLRALLLRRVGFAQGDAAISAIDSTRLRSALLKNKRPDLASLSTAVRDHVTLIRSLDRQLERSKDEQIKALPDLGLLGDEQPIALAREVVEVLRLTPNVPTGLGPKVLDAAEAVTESNVEEVTSTIDLFSRWDELSQMDKAGLVGGTWYGAAQRIVSFIVITLDAIAKATPAGQRLGERDVDAAGQRWRTALADAQRLMEGRW